MRGRPLQAKYSLLGLLEVQGRVWITSFALILLTKQSYLFVLMVDLRTHHVTLTVLMNEFRHA